MHVQIVAVGKEADGRPIHDVGELRAARADGDGDDVTEFIASRGPARADTPMVEEAKIGVEHAAPRHVVHACVIPIVPVGMAEVMTASATSELKRPALSRTPAEGLPVQVVHTDADARVHVIPDGVANPSGNIAST